MHFVWGFFIVIQLTYMVALVLDVQYNDLIYI